METTWIVAADASRARVLQVASRSKLTEVASLDNPEMFAKRIGDYLEKARVEHRYDKLVVIAPPHILGALRKEYGKEVGRLVSDELPKDRSMLTPRELEGYFSKDGRAI